MAIVRTAVAATLLVVLAAAAARAADQPFAPGERLRLKMTYFVMTAGEVVVEVDDGVLDGRPVWPIAAHVKTRGLVNAFFSLDNHFVSYFDSAQGRSIGSDLVANENGDKHNDTVRMRGQQAFVRIEGGGRVREETREIDPESGDVLSALYRLRTLALAPGDSLQLPIFDGRKAWTLEVNVAGRERVKTEAGTFDALHLRCKTHFDGKYKSDRELEIWLSDDARRIPVKAAAFFYIATLRVQLKSYRPAE